MGHINKTTGQELNWQNGLLDNVLRSNPKKIHVTRTEYKEIMTKITKS